MNHAFNNEDGDLLALPIAQRRAVHEGHELLEDGLRKVVFHASRGTMEPSPLELQYKTAVHRLKEISVGAGLEVSEAHFLSSRFRPHYIRTCGHRKFVGLGFLLSRRLAECHD